MDVHFLVHSHGSPFVATDVSEYQRAFVWPLGVAGTCDDQVAQITIEQQRNNSTHSMTVFLIV